MKRVLFNAISVLYPLVVLPYIQVQTKLKLYDKYGSIHLENVVGAIIVSLLFLMLSMWFLCSCLSNIENISTVFPIIGLAEGICTFFPSTWRLFPINIYSIFLQNFNHWIFVCCLASLIYLRILIKKILRN